MRFSDNWTPSLLPRRIFNWRTFSRRFKHVGDVSEQKFKCQPLRTWEIGGVRLLETLYGIWCAYADHIPSNVLKTVFHKIYLVYSCILCLICFENSFDSRKDSAVKKQVFIITNSKVIWNSMYPDYFLVYWLFSQIDNVIFRLLLTTDVLKLKRLQFGTVLTTYLTSLICHIPTIL